MDNNALSNIAKEIKNQLDLKIDELSNIDDDRLYQEIDEALYFYEKNYNKFFSINEKMYLRKIIYSIYCELDILQELIDDKSVSEIMINGKDDIFIERNGKVVRWNKKFLSDDLLDNLIQKIVGNINRVINTSSPIVDARLKDGSRVHIVIAPIALNGPIITIRKFPEPISMEKLISYGSLDDEVAQFLKKLILSGYNIFVSGETNSGKTTFLNALSDFIPEDERVITIEDSAELNLRHIKNIVRLESRNPNSEGEGEINIADLIKAALRMNPDRIIVGEVRSKEALDMLQAMNTGHDGSLSTGHANSPRDMLSRIETMVLSGVNMPVSAIRAQIASAIDIIIQLGRLSDKSRRVIEIVEIGELKEDKIETNTLYEYVFIEEEKRFRLRKKNELKNTKKLIKSGIQL